MHWRAQSGSRAIGVGVQQDKPQEMVARKLVSNQDLGTETVGMTKSRVGVSELWPMGQI